MRSERGEGRQTCTDAAESCPGDCRLTARFRFSPWVSSAGDSTSIGPCADEVSRPPPGDCAEGEKNGGRASGAPALPPGAPRAGARGWPPKALERTGLCSAMERRKDRSSRVGNLLERQQSMHVRAACWEQPKS